jgi:hypothetical protein
VSYKTKQKKIAERKRRAAIKRKARSANATWRSKPATAPQLRVLRFIKAETGEV